MNRRKLEALRNLAERPGTEAEGIVAREFLARLESQRPQATDLDGDLWPILDGHARGAVSQVEFVEAMRRRAMRWSAENLPTHWQCACGARLSVSQKCCGNTVGHLLIQTEIRERFKKGDRVFYNYWAYGLNSPAIVVSYVRLEPENGTHPWAWLRLKFDHLKANRKVPIRSVKGWHLTHAPLPEPDALRMGRP